MAFKSCVLYLIEHSQSKHPIMSATPRFLPKQYPGAPGACGWAPPSQNAIWQRRGPGPRRPRSLLPWSSLLPINIHCSFKITQADQHLCKIVVIYGILWLSIPCYSHFWWRSYRSSDRHFHWIHPLHHPMNHRRACQALLVIGAHLCDGIGRRWKGWPRCWFDAVHFFHMLDWEFDAFWR